MRYRNSDVSLVNLDANGSSTNILTMEAPPSKRKESAYRTRPSGPTPLSMEKIRSGRNPPPGADPSFSPARSPSSPGFEKMQMQMQMHSSPGTSPGRERTYSGKYSPTVERLQGKQSPLVEKAYIP
jgi:hypothetical protein